MARSKAKETAREARHEPRRRFGMPLALKMALLTAVLAALIVVVFSVAVQPFLRDTLREQVRRAAWETAFVLAAAPPQAWNEYLGTPWGDLTADELAVQIARMSREEQDASVRSKETLAIRKWNAERLYRLTLKHTRVEAVEVVEGPPDRRRLLASSLPGLREVAFTPATEQTSLDLPEGSADEGRLRLGDREVRAVRGTYPIVDTNGAPVGEARVYVSVEAIDEVFANLVSRLVFTALIVVTAGALLAGFVGVWFMRPLRLLQEDVRTVAKGDLRHRTRAISYDEIGALARSFDELTQQLAAAADAEREAQASKHQMAVAGEVSASLFPARLPTRPGYDAAGLHETSTQLAGEYYDVFEMPQGRLGFLVASASGTGVPAAMVMAMARSFVAALAGREADPGAILREANALLSPDLRRGMYVTVLLAILDPRTHTLTVANAGHAPLLLVRGGKLTAVHSEGIAMGLDKGPVFDSTLKVVRLALQPGDRAVLYTPGVTRVNGADGSTLGEERFAALARREAVHPAETFTARMGATIRKFRGEAPITDSVTLLTLGRLQDGGTPS
jgi:serine phosphatase RsbU (regulator of sigma subunit)